MTDKEPKRGRRSGRESSFALRLGLTLLVTVAAIGAAQYVLATDRLTQRVVEQATVAHEGDARVLRGLYQEAREDRWEPVNELLGHIASRPGVKEVAVVGPDGDVVAVGAAMAHASGPGTSDHASGMKMEGAAPEEDKHESGGAMKMDTAPETDKHGSGAGMKMDGMAPEEDKHGSGGAMEMDMAPPRSGSFVVGERPPVKRRGVIESALSARRSFGGEDPAGRRAENLYVIPVSLQGRHHALTIVKDSEALRAQLHDMRWILLGTLGAGMLLAFPVFYLLGGRSLTLRYTRAVRRSSRDALTGLGNHRTFHEELRRLTEVALRRDKCLTLALLDVDNFKQVNDTRGHRYGDTVLARVGDLLASTRAEDRSFRIGGDEFALILPDTTAAEAADVAERVRCRVAEELEIATTSIGIAELRAPSPDVDTLLACADLALYDAKNCGRNRISIFAPADEVPTASS